LFVKEIAVHFAEGHEHLLDDLVCVGSVLEKKHYKEKFLELEKFHGNYMSRSTKKGPYVDERVLKKVMKQKQTKDFGPIKTWSRSCQIAPEFVGHKMAIHNGRKFIEVLISEGMVGHRLGEFSPTRTFRSHGKVTKKVVEAT